MTKTTLLGAGYVASEPVGLTIRSENPTGRYYYSNGNVTNMPPFNYITDQELSAYRDMPGGESKVLAIGTVYACITVDQFWQHKPLNDIQIDRLQVHPRTRELPRYKCQEMGNYHQLQPIISPPDVGLEDLPLIDIDGRQYCVLDKNDFMFQVEKTQYINAGRTFENSGHCSVRAVDHNRDMSDFNLTFVFKYQLWGNS